MDKSIIKRLEALEGRKPSDLIIYAYSDSGDMTTGRVRDIISKGGELREGFSGIGDLERLIISGNSKKDLDRLLLYMRENALKDMDK